MLRDREWRGEPGWDWEGGVWSVPPPRDRPLEGLGGVIFRPASPVTNPKEPQGHRGPGKGVPVQPLRGDVCVCGVGLV